MNNLLTLIELTFPNAVWGWSRINNIIVCADGQDKVSIELLELIVAKFDGWKVHLDELGLAVHLPQK